MRKLSRRKNGKLRTFLIFTLVELFFLYRNINGDLELFFMLWGLFSLALLILNVTAGLSEGGVPSGIGLPNDNNGPDNTLLAMQAFNDKSSGHKNGFIGGFMDPHNLAYLILLVLNIIGYLIVMP